jgi:hypothetical protein
MKNIVEKDINLIKKYDIENVLESERPIEVQKIKIGFVS